jgi:hypothetical protein
MSGAFFCLLLSSFPNWAEPEPVNLDFQAASLAGWEGEGFRIVALASKDEKHRFVVASPDDAGKGHKALLHRAVLLPADAAVIRFKGAAVRAPGCQANNNLEIVLVDKARRVLPRLERTSGGDRPSAVLLEAPLGQGREYIWRVTAYAGQAVRIVLVDEDDRPGCYVHTEGFRILSRGALAGEEFCREMAKLIERAELAPTVRYESKHFLALSNAGEGFSGARLRDCELIYNCFWDHFLKKGFELHEPDTQLMMAVFDSRAGFQAYLGKEVPTFFSGMYQRDTNRFVTYDFGQNEGLLAAKRAAARSMRRIDSQILRQRSLDGINRWASGRRGDVNVATMMHEVAHQLTFNCGMLNREGDVPVWSAEGLACYCEATSDGTWQGIGEISAERAVPLAEAIHEKRALLSVRDLVSSEQWLRRKSNEQNILLGYAQSWALMRMLLEEQPREVRAYLSLIYPRRTPDHRLVDFAEIFGADFANLQQRHEEYVANLVRLLPRTAP